MNLNMNDTNNNKFYKNAASYWASVPATLDGILGGYGHISDIDIAGSKVFLHKIFAMNNHPDTKLALDCGAGIGRVSKHLLIPYFDKVDLIEQDEKFINTAKEYIGVDNEKLGTIYQMGLQNFVYEPHKKYDVIWCQWVLGHLEDFDLIGFLKKSRYALNHNGIVVIKENVSSTQLVDFDDEDSSVTRPLWQLEQIIFETKYDVLFSEIQKGFPDDIYPVYSFALKPILF